VLLPFHHAFFLERSAVHGLLSAPTAGQQTMT
jgi:hypothetical protein